MIFSRAEVLICVLSLVGLSGAHRAILPRAIRSTQTESSGTTQTSANSPRTVNTVPNSNPRNKTVSRPTSNSGSSNSTNSPFIPDHPEWEYLNGMTWWKTDPTQQDHLRFHCYLSMASYGDYATLCPSTFTQGFTVLERFDTPDGQGGFVALIPEMVKVVIVFRGYENYWDLDWNEASIEDLVTDCPGCTVAAGVKKLYLSARAATNNWAIAKKKVAETGLRFSVTGHGLGGSVAALAAMELGSQNYVHYSHNQGMPRSFNYASMVRYDNLFQVLAGQSIVSENDYFVQLISPNPYYHVGSKVKILGPMQQWLINCYGNNENTTCTGNGSNYPIHNVYFTPKGQCGKANKGW